MVEPPLIIRVSPFWINAAAHCAMRVYLGRAKIDSLGKRRFTLDEVICGNRAAMGSVGRGREPRVNQDPGGLYRAKPRTARKARSRRAGLVDEPGVSTRIDVEREEIRRAVYRMPGVIRRQAQAEYCFQTLPVSFAPPLRIGIAIATNLKH